MPYCISEVRHREFPSANAVSAALAPLGLSLDDVIAAFRGYICPIAPSTGRGYQADLADHIKGYLEQSLARDGLRPTRNKQFLSYSSALNEHADFGLIHERSNRTVFFEVEFRPNFERDLIKFQIAAREGRLAAAVMVLSIDPKSIDTTFATMPSYEAVTRVVEVLQPSYPLLAIGLRGSHAA